MRIIALVQNYSIVSVSTLGALLERGEFIEVYSVKGVIRKKSLLEFLKYSFKNDGIRYLINKFKFLINAKLRVIFARAIHKHGNPVFFSLEELKKVHDFHINYVTNINAKKVVKEIESLSPDVIFSCSFPYIIKPGILYLPSKGSINLHRSYLPQYQGCNPIFWVRAFKEQKTGITIHYMTEKLDKGEIITQTAIDIDPDKDDYVSIMIKMAHELEQLIDRALNNVLDPDFNPKEQDQTGASTFKCPKKSDRIKYNIWD